jgi:hypothetical protein
MTETRRFIFIGGAEGSGTTLLLRILSRPDGCVSLGGNHVKLPDGPEAQRLAVEFEHINRRVWDRHADLEQSIASRCDWIAITAQILLSPAFSTQSHFLLKRSFPFAMPRNRYTPDLWDVADILPNARVVLIYRDPCATTFSALRRGFDTDLRRIAVSCGEQLTYLAAQAAAAGADRVRVVSYERLCREPARVVKSIGEFCGLTMAAIATAVSAEAMHQRTDERYANELAAEQVTWLRRFFDGRRRAQWRLLEASLHAD